MNTLQTAKPLDAGIGFVRWKRTQDDVRTAKEAKAVKAGAKPHRVALYTGTLQLPGTPQVRAALFVKGETRTGRYEFVVKQPPQDQVQGDEQTETEAHPWPVLSTFSLPMFGAANYTEGLMPFGSRKYKVRVIKDAARGYWLVRLPDVARGAKDLAENSW